MHVARNVDTTVTSLGMAVPDPASILVFFDPAQQAFFEVFICIQVGGVDVHPVTASMQDPMAFGDRSDPDFVGQPMRVKCFVRQAEAAVAAGPAPGP